LAMRNLGETFSFSCNRKVIMSAFRNLEMSSIMPHTKGVRHEKRGDNFSEKQGIKEVKSS
jgi:hypothetical protein